jgi:hypothetical protein
LVSVVTLAQDRHQVNFSTLEKTPLTYLRIMVKEGSFVGYTDLSGYLHYKEDQIPKNSSLYISGYGINDTIFTLQNLKELDTVFLKSKEIVLPEFAVSSAQLEKLIIGNSNEGGWEVKSPIKSSNPKEGSVYRYTIRIKIPKNKGYYLGELKFFVSKILTSKVDLSLRVLVPKPTLKIKPGTINYIQDFSELLKENMIVTIDDPGWKTVEFMEPVLIPEGVKDLFFVFDLLEEKPTSNFALANQKTSKSIDLGFYSTEGHIGVFNLDPIHPAVEVTFLKEK